MDTLVKLLVKSSTGSQGVRTLFFTVDKLCFLSKNQSIYDDEAVTKRAFVTQSFGSASRSRLADLGLQDELGGCPIPQNFNDVCMLAHMAYVGYHPLVTRDSNLVKAIGKQSSERQFVGNFLVPVHGKQ